MRAKDEYIHISFVLVSAIISGNPVSSSKQDKFLT